LSLRLKETGQFLSLGSNVIIAALSVEIPGARRLVLGETLHWNAA
jgi:hypothetical protein